MTKSSEHPDRTVFQTFRPPTAKWNIWYRVSGGVFFVLGVLYVVLDPGPLGFLWMAMGLMWWFTPLLNRWEQNRYTYVDQMVVSWPRVRRHSVLLSDIATVHTDSENPRWATRVILTLTDGSTRQLRTVEPVRLLEVVESRIPR